VGEQGLQRALVDHGDDTTFDSPAKEFGAESVADHGAVAFPALGLRIDVGKEFAERLEFNEAVERKGHRVAVF